MNNFITDVTYKWFANFYFEKKMGIPILNYTGLLVSGSEFYECGQLRAVNIVTEDVVLVITKV